ncbi:MULTISPECIES: CPBP family intramembrane glutamic endopeptidase [Luteibacter]|uniref:CPBP family intramembrane glutamic endopeptidase n=1 Tax=Luteibacter TaxID=242605 RepID=UPI00068AF364|nr:MULTISPECIES: type II CAAX endopeptidase family protein [unclassified Luteibacter]
MTPQRTWQPIGWFLFWLVVLSAPVDLLSIHAGVTPPMLSRISMWCPGVAAVITTVQLRLPWGALGLRAPERRFWLAGYFIPWVYAIPVYLLVWTFVAGGWGWMSYVASQSGMYHIATHQALFSALFGIPSTLTFGVLSTVVWTLGEELGWRGFLSPRLADHMGVTGAGLVVGLVWAVWHYPILLGADYNAGTPPLYAVSCFTVMVVAMGVSMAWLREVSGSVWPCVLLHASHNILVQGVLDAMTAREGQAVYVTTEFGWGMALTETLMAVYLAVQAKRSVAFMRPLASGLPD